MQKVTSEITDLQTGQKEITHEIGEIKRNSTRFENKLDKVLHALHGGNPNVKPPRAVNGGVSAPAKIGRAHV